MPANFPFPAPSSPSASRNRSASATPSGAPALFIADDPFYDPVARRSWSSRTTPVPCGNSPTPTTRPAAASAVAATEVPREQTNRYGIPDIGKDDGRLVEVKGLVENLGSAGGAVQPLNHRPLRAVDPRCHRLPRRGMGSWRRQRGAASPTPWRSFDRPGAVPRPALTRAAASGLRRQDRLPGSSSDRVRPKAPRPGRPGRPRVPEAVYTD